MPPATRAKRLVRTKRCFLRMWLLPKVDASPVCLYHQAALPIVSGALSGNVRQTALLPNVAALAPTRAALVSRMRFPPTLRRAGPGWVEMVRASNDALKKTQEMVTTLT